MEEAEAIEIIDDIVRRFPASEWMERCMKAIPESDPGFIMAMIEISCGGDVKILS